MTRLAAEGMFVRRPSVRASAVCVCVCVLCFAHVRVLVTRGLSVGHVLFLTIRPHPSEKEREKETGPVRIHYSNHLEDSRKERTGGKKVGHNNKPWALTP